jgi:hypothetical protein
VDEDDHYPIVDPWCVPPDSSRCVVQAHVNEHTCYAIDEHYGTVDPNAYPDEDNRNSDGQSGTYTWQAGSQAYSSGGHDGEQYTNQEAHSSNFNGFGSSADDQHSDFYSSKSGAQESHTMSYEAPDDESKFGRRAPYSPGGAYDPSDDLCLATDYLAALDLGADTQSYEANHQDFFMSSAPVEYGHSLTSYHRYESLTFLREDP